VLIPLSPEILLRAYAAGIFPMAETADDPELFWVDPKRRGIIPLDSFHVPRRLRRIVRQNPFTIRCDTAFEAVMRGCAESSEKRPNTWINDEILELYAGLFERGAMQPLTFIAILALFLPNMALAVRRLHDTGRSGWWLLLMLIPLVGPLVLLYWYVQPSEEAPNQYG
jgi:hypothetical protein